MTVWVKTVLGISLLLCLSARHDCTLCAQISPTIQDPTRIRAGLMDASWEKRRKAFYMLLGFETPEKWDGRTYLIPRELASVFRARPENTDELKVALIHLLDTENSEVKLQNKGSARDGRPLDEEYTDYYGDVIEAVAGLGDQRALEALMGAMGTGGMAANGLAVIGTPALDALIKASENADPGFRLAAFRALTVMWRPEHRANFSDDTSSEELQAAFLRAVSDRDESIRSVGAIGLGLTPKPGEHTIQVLVTLAVSDPAVLPGEADDGGPLYPVRRAASKSLAQLGPTALDPLIDRFSVKDTMIRAAVVRALAIMWEPNNRRPFGDTGYEEKFSAIFLRAATDKDVGVRMASVQGLALMANPETIHELRELAASDPATSSSRGDVGVPVYPVRQLAARALKQTVDSEKFR